MREVALWSRLGVADKMPTRCYKSKRRGKREAERFHIFLQMFWCLCLKHVWNSLAIASSCQERNVRFDGRRERTESWWKARTSRKKKTVCACSAIHGVWTLEGDWWFFFLCPGKTILNPLGWEHLEGIPIPMEGKLAPDGRTKPRSRGCESKVRSGGLMWKQKKDQWITLDHFASLLTV